MFEDSQCKKAFLNAMKIFICSNKNRKILDDNKKASAPETTAELQARRLELKDKDKIYDIVRDPSYKYSVAAERRFLNDPSYAFLTSYFTKTGTTFYSKKIKQEIDEDREKYKKAIAFLGKTGQKTLDSTDGENSETQTLK